MPAGRGTVTGPGSRPRARCLADVDGCLRLAERVRAADGYPPYLADEELPRFVFSADALAAWVIDRGDRVVGHVALHRRSSGPVMALVRERLGVTDEQVAVVARLFVDPDERRRGIGSSLLGAAVAEARRRRRRSVLDVVTHFDAALHLYERRGWARLGSVTLELGEGRRLDEHVYREVLGVRRPGDSVTDQ